MDTADVNSFGEYWLLNLQLQCFFIGIWEIIFWTITLAFCLTAIIECTYYNSFTGRRLRARYDRLLNQIEGDRARRLSRIFELGIHLFPSEINRRLELQDMERLLKQNRLFVRKVYLVTSVIITLSIVRIVLAAILLHGIQENNIEKVNTWSNAVISWFLIKISLCIIAEWTCNYFRHSYLLYYGCIFRCLMDFSSIVIVSKFLTEMKNTIPTTPKE